MVDVFLDFRGNVGGFHGFAALCRYLAKKVARREVLISELTGHRFCRRGFSRSKRAGDGDKLLFHSLILTYRGLRVNLFHEVEHDGNGDEERGAADGYRCDTRYSLQNDGEHRERAEKERAHERNARDDIAEVLARG